MSPTSSVQSTANPSPHHAKKPFLLSIYGIPIYLFIYLYFKNLPLAPITGFNAFPIMTEID